MAEMARDEPDQNLFSRVNSTVIVLTINEVSEPELEPIFSTFLDIKYIKNGTDLRLFGCDMDICNRKNVRKSVAFGCKLSVFRF